MATADLCEFERVLNVKNAARARLMAIPGVHGVGVGYKYRGGRETDELAVVVMLFKKRPVADVPLSEVIPPEIDGVKTDVREADLPEYADDSARYRPLRGGSKLQWSQTIVSHPAPNTTSTVTKTRDGTLGCMAIAKKTGKKVLLTNAHVVAGCDLPETSIGRRIGQPNDESDYTCCSKCWATVVGTVIAAKKHPNNPDVDVAIVELDKCVDPSPQVEGLGPIHGVLTTNELNALALSSASVFVRGFRTGEKRQGVVKKADYDGSIVCRVDDDSSSVIHGFQHVMRVETHAASSGPFGQKGDSGSVVLDANGKVVGLFFGQGPVEGVPSFFVCRIDRILATFKADFDLEILTNPAHLHMGMSDPEPRPSLSEPEAIIVGFDPAPEDLKLLERARDEVLATPLGQHVMGIISRHVQEIRVLIRTKDRVAAVWRRVAAPELLQGLVDALRSPDTAFSQIVKGAPLPDRIAQLVHVLTRYGSKSLIADLDRLVPVATRWSDASYRELRTWLETTPPDQL